MQKLAILLAVLLFNAVPTEAACIFGAGTAGQGVENPGSPMHP